MQQSDGAEEDDEHHGCGFGGVILVGCPFVVGGHVAGDCW